MPSEVTSRKDSGVNVGWWVGLVNRDVRGRTSGGHDTVGFSLHRCKGCWLFVSFGESHLAVLYQIDFIIRSPCSELPFQRCFHQK